MKFLPAIKSMAITMACVAGCAVGFEATVFAAPSFKDVPSAHWAYNSVTAVAEQGLMVGDTTGSFKPASLIDKFETMKILARAAGYKYTGVSETEQTYYNRAYEKNKSMLANYGKSFSKWNSSADREISFLIEKEIVTQEDLKQFVIKDATGSEKLRALSREEAVVFLVKLTGEKDTALGKSYTYAFKDDASITLACKPYVYYMQSKGIVTGDTAGKFNPNAAVDRASMAVMLDKALSVSQINGQAASDQSNSGVSKVTNITGVFDKYYPQLSAAQIVLSDGKKKIYKLTENTTIYIDSYLKTSGDLKEGMALTAVVVNDDEMLDIKATSKVTPPEETSPAVLSQPDSAAAQNYYVEGIVSAINGEANNRTIDVEVRMLNPRGEIITEIRKYTVLASGKIYRGETEVTIDTIVRGDVARVDYSGSTATKITLEQKDRVFTNVTLAEKKYVEATETPILVLQDGNGKRFDLRVTDETTLTRRGVGGVAWKDLRIGDTIEAKAEYDKLLTLSANGSYSNIEGVIAEIHLTKNSGSIVLLNDATKKNETYSLITSMLDVYSLRLGDKVKLRLDSLEVESVVTVTPASTNYITGYIQSISKDTITLRDQANPSVNGKQVKYDVNTIATNAKDGARVNPASLTAGLKVYIVFTTPVSNVAQTISILAE